MMKLIVVILSFVFSLNCSARLEQNDATVAFSSELFLSRTSTIGGEAVNYRVFVPRNREPGERLPVLLYLHGSDDRGNDNSKQLNALAPLIVQRPDWFRMIVVFPQCAADNFWDADQIRNARYALMDAVTEFDGDESRVFLSGHSLGAFGVWTMSTDQTFPMAGIIPISGRVLARPGEKEKLDRAGKEITDSSDPYKELALRLGKLPIWIFHGLDDKIVPIDSARKISHALVAAGNDNARFSELKDVGHNAVSEVFGKPEIFQWMAQQKNPNVSYENLRVTDDMAYGAVIEAIAYDDDAEKIFGPIGGFSLLLIKRETLPRLVSDLVYDSDVAPDLYMNHMSQDSRPIKLRDQYDAKVHFKVTDDVGSPEQIYKKSVIVEPSLAGVAGFSKVAFDNNHSRSLVMVYFYGREEKLISRYCVINWKREWSGIHTSGRKWYEHI